MEERMSQEAKIIGGIGIITIALLFGIVFFFSNSKPPVDSSGFADPNLLIKPDSNKIATDSAKITIVEFGDYQCPACAAAHPIVQRVLSDYPGKINFVFRHFPLPMHGNAMIAAEAVEAAGEQGKYWEMHYKVYQTQKEWSENTNPLVIYLSYARQMNLNLELFESSVTLNKYNSKIVSDKKDGTSLGVNGTPTFYINGKKMRGYDYNEFKRLIEQVIK
jgi:protein-disulfide isomerase